MNLFVIVYFNENFIQNVWLKFIYLSKKYLHWNFYKQLYKKTDLKRVKNIFEFDSTREQHDRETVYTSKPSRFSRIWFTHGMAWITSRQLRGKRCESRVTPYIELGELEARGIKSPSLWHAFPDRGNFVKTCAVITT